MPTALDQFINALEAQAVPPVFVAILAAALLCLLFKRLEHTIIRVVRSARGGRQMAKVVTNRNVGSAGVVRYCPICHSQMIRRKARRGSSTGQEVWRCPNYPDCRGTRPVSGKLTEARS
jgi:restriction system protein